MIGMKKVIKPNDTIYVPSGEYDVYIYDSIYFCLDTVSVTCNALYKIEVYESIYHVDCFGDSTGLAIIITGGTAPYTYDWYDAPGSQTDSNATGLPIGTYHVEVTDASGCIDTGVVSLVQSSDVLITSDSVVSSCSGICDGIAIISVDGGEAPYSYDWFENDNINNDSIYNLCADTFRVEVTDALGCIDTADVIVTEPVSLIALAVDSSAATCNGGDNGSAVVGGSGGTLPYTYWWNDAINQENDTAVNLLGGVYQAAVIDVNGCSDTVLITVEEPGLMTPNECKIGIMPEWCM